MADRSLRFGLLIRLSSALIVLLVLDAVACYVTALYFANRVYDRWMSDDARSLAQAVHTSNGQVRFDLPAVGLQVFQFDSIDKNYFRISSAQQGYIAGERDLPDPPAGEPGSTQIRYTTVDGQKVRQVSTRITPPLSQDVVTIEVAETLMKRSTLAREILLGMAAPQVALLAFALLLAWLGVSRGLKPLTDLAAQIEARDQNNLSPISQEVSPRETRVLVGRLNDLLGRLHSAIQAQKRFVADAAHQLRTPLAAVMLHAERAERAADTATEREALRALRKSTERAARLSQQLLSLARAEPGAAIVVELKPIDLGALARRVGEEWIPRALEQDVDFGLIVPDEAVSIAGDDRLLAEMLSNLIDNALRYGGRSGHVTVIVEGGRTPRISVQDDGPGIPAEERQKIFERFYRVTGSCGEGCGLGLAIVLEIARLHGSTVEVSPGLDDRGSRFTVSFAPEAHRSLNAASA
jgi:two-component system, OmpR family, sensor histidine kinase TctE